MNTRPSKPFRSESIFDPFTRKLIRYLERVHDVYLPQRLLDFADDKQRLQAFEGAIKRAINHGGRVESLHAGIGSVFTAMLAVRFGVSKSTVCEKWPYLASIYNTLIDENGMSDRIQVMNTALTDLKLRKDTDALPNLLILDCIDPGLLGNGIGIYCQFAKQNLLSPDAQIIPRGATVYAMPVELRTDKICGFDLSPFNRYRRNPIYERIRLNRENYEPLADPFVCFEFDFSEPLTPEEKIISIITSNSGILNAVAYWFDLHLDEEIPLSPNPSMPVASTRPQALQYLNGEVKLQMGEDFQFRASHNCKKIHFELMKHKASGYGMNRLKPAIPHWHFPMIADQSRNGKYEAAIVRAVNRMESPRVLDIGTGTGLLAMMASRAGAHTVTACEVIPHIAQIAGDILEMNGYGDHIHLIPKSSFDIQVPRDMTQKANILVSETVDHSLLGEGFLAALTHARQFLLEDNPIIIPAAAIVYAAGIEIRTENLDGFNATPLNLLRLNHYTGLDLNSVEHRRLTHEFETFSFDFCDLEFKPDQRVFEIPVELDGYCNAITFWYRLFLDQETCIDTGPDSGTIAWQQAVNFLDQEIPVKKGDRLPIIGYHNLHMLGFGIDHVGSMLQGIPMTQKEHPRWLERLMEEEKDFQSYTREINDQIGQTDAQRVDKALNTVLENAVDLGFDPIIVSDFIIQLGYQL